MPVAERHADALEVQYGGNAVRSLRAVGTLPGVVIVSVAGRNGPGVGWLKSYGDGTELAWKAPGSSAFGERVNCSYSQGVGSDPIFEPEHYYALLEDGTDPDKWIRVEVVHDFLPGNPTTARVLLQDVYNNAIGSDDISASEAAAGDTETVTLTLKNNGSFAMTDLRCWLDKVVHPTAPVIATSGIRRRTRRHSALICVGAAPSGYVLHSRADRLYRRPASGVIAAKRRPDTQYLSISKNNVDFYAPDNEEHANVIQWDTLAAAGTTSLYVKRTVAAGAAADPAILNALHFAWTNLL